MTPEHQRARATIKAAIKKWKALVPPGFDLRHLFIEGTAAEGEETTIANTLVNWEYHNGCIKWYLDAASSSTDQYLEQTVVHELVHVLIAPIESQLPDKQHKLSEFVVEGIARAVQRVHK